MSSAVGTRTRFNPIGLTGFERHNWVSDKLQLIDRGKVQQVIRILKGYRGKARERITNLSKYLKRFSDTVHYEKFLAQGFPIGSGEVESAITLYTAEASQDFRGNLASRYC